MAAAVQPAPPPDPTGAGAAESEAGESECVTGKLPPRVPQGHAAPAESSASTAPGLFQDAADEGRPGSPDSGTVNGSNAPGQTPGSAAGGQGSALSDGGEASAPVLEHAVPGLISVEAGLAAEEGEEAYGMGLFDDEEPWVNVEDASTSQPAAVERKAELVGPWGAYSTGQGAKKSAKKKVIGGSNRCLLSMDVPPKRGVPRKPRGPFLPGQQRASDTTNGVQGAAAMPLQ
jgi:hypothetical protein